MSIRLRPHHVLCSIGFDGHGYSDAFTANMSNVVNGQLRSATGHETTVWISAHADTYCAPCPKRRGLGCEQQEKIDDLDRRHAETLGLEAGQILTWGDCLDRVVERVQPDDLDRLCESCSWLELGLCKSAVERLHAERETPSPKERRSM